MRKASLLLAALLISCAHAPQTTPAPAGDSRARAADLSTPSPATTPVSADAPRRCQADVQVHRETPALLGLAYGNGYYVSVGRAGRILRSTDGQRWLPVQSPTACHLYAVAYGAGRFVAVGELSTVLTSVDGLAWQAVPVVAGMYDLQSIIWAGFFMVTGPVHFNLKSADGLTWGPLPTGSNSFTGVVWTGNRFLGAVWNGPLLNSATGEQWEPVQTPLPAPEISALGYGEGRAVAACAGGSVLTAADGEHWQASQSGLDGQPRALANGGGRFALLGDAGTLRWSQDGGVHWAASGGGTPAHITALAYLHDRFIIATPDGLYSSADGSNWQPGRLAARPEHVVAAYMSDWRWSSNRQPLYASVAADAPRLAGIVAMADQLVSLADFSLQPFAITTMGSSTPRLNLVAASGAMTTVEFAFHCDAGPDLPRCERSADAVLVNGWPFGGKGLAQYLAEQRYLNDFAPRDGPLLLVLSPAPDAHDHVVVRPGEAMLVRGFAAPTAEAAVTLAGFGGHTAHVGSVPVGPGGDWSWQGNLPAFLTPGEYRFCAGAQPACVLRVSVTGGP